MDAEKHAPVEARHREGAREIAEAYIRGRYGVFASIEVLRAIETVGWEGKVAQALADEFERGRQAGLDGAHEVLEGCRPRGGGWG